MTIFLFLILAFLNKVQASDPEIETLLKKQSEVQSQCESLRLLTIDVVENKKKKTALEIDSKRLEYGEQICQIALDKVGEYYVSLEEANVTLESIFEEVDKIKSQESSVVIFPLEFTNRSKLKIIPFLEKLRKIESGYIESLRLQEFPIIGEFILETPSKPQIKYSIYIPHLNLIDLTWENIKESFNVENRESLRNKMFSKQKELSEIISRNLSTKRELTLANNFINSLIEVTSKHYVALEEKVSTILIKFKLPL